MRISSKEFVHHLTIPTENELFRKIHLFLSFRELEDKRRMRNKGMHCLFTCWFLSFCCASFGQVESSVVKERWEVS